ncbi:MAG: hypothetical protein H6550_10820 [Chitinophagales bacterium]|nr:hypothetical protein [Chitinophagales bacterium]
MKRQTLIAITVFAASIALTSCQKTYRCSCQLMDSATPYQTDVKGATRASAKQNCTDISKDQDQPYYDGPLNCHLVS